MESLSSLNIIFAKLPGGKPTGPGGFHFFMYFPAEILEFSFNPGAKLDGYQVTWAGCKNFLVLKPCDYSLNQTDSFQLISEIFLDPKMITGFVLPYYIDMNHICAKLIAFNPNKTGRFKSSYFWVVSI